MTLNENFAPYWTEKVQKTWVNILGRLLDENPNTWEGARVTWSDMMEFIKGLQTPLFKSGWSHLASNSEQPCICKYMQDANSSGNGCMDG